MLINPYRFGFTPSSLSGLVAWFRANSLSLSDGNAVSSWNDSSSGGHNLSQVTPSKRPIFKTNIQNGLPAVRFDGVDDLLKGSLSAGLTNSSLLFVGRINATPSGEDLPFGVGQSGTARKIRSFYAANTTTHLSYATWSDDQINPASTPLWDYGGAYHIFSATQGGNAIVLARDGVDVGLTLPSVPLVTLTDFFIGGSEPNTGYYSNLDMLEALIYDRQVSATEREQLETYLSNKYDIAI
jgi:hypothetical protein